jgi:membrane protein
MPSPTEAGRHATSPWAMPAQGWKEVLVRSWKEASQDNVGLIAAGVAFYGFLALVPLLGAIVLSYGLVASPETVMANMRSLTSVMPAQAAQLVGEQLMNVVQTSGGKKGLGLLFALAVALFGARNGAGSIMTALNIAYEEEEKRGFLRVNLTALAITAGAVLVAIVAVIAVAALGHLERLIPGAPGVLITLGKLMTYVLLLLAAAAVAATLYRYGPSRAKAKWVWLTPGSLLAALGGVALTIGFGIYVANFGNYNATYGSLGAVVVLLTWLYLSSYILLFGAELNSELEHQTTADTTAGADQPVGARGAWAADNVASGQDTAKPAVRPDTLPATPQPNRPSSSADYLAARAATRVGRVVGLKKVGMLSSGIATLGLALLRRRGREVPGIAALAGAAGLAWLGREKTAAARKVARI